jgi:hypothetical protein
MLTLTEAAEFRLEAVLEWMRELDKIARHVDVSTRFELGLYRKLNYLRTYGLFKTQPDGSRFIDVQSEMNVILMPDGMWSCNFGVAWKNPGDPKPFMDGLLHWSGPSKGQIIDVALADEVRRKGASWEWSVHT